MCGRAEEQSGLESRRGGRREGSAAATATTLTHLCVSVCIYSTRATLGRIGQKNKTKASLEHLHRNRKHRQLQPSTFEPSVSIKKTCLFRYLTAIDLLMN